jgi:hypothetical protein
MTPASDRSGGATAGAPPKISVPVTSPGMRPGRSGKTSERQGCDCPSTTASARVAVAAMVDIPRGGTGRTAAV